MQHLISSYRGGEGVGPDEALQLGEISEQETT